jgi:uncharacterized membrane protein YedE/YeeE
MDNLLVALVLGVGFGFALNKGGLTKYRRIAGQFRFTDMTVLKFMLTGILTGMVGLYALLGAGLISGFPYVPPTFVAGNLIGGLIFGVGMSLAGYCPGTCFAGAGEGKLDYLLPGVLGLIAGAALYGLTYPYIGQPIQLWAYNTNFGALMLPSWLGLDPYLVIILFTLVVLIVFYMIGRGMSRAEKLNEPEPTGEGNSLAAWSGDGATIEKV